jgi:hypothetical protein
MFRFVPEAFFGEKVFEIMELGASLSCLFHVPVEYTTCQKARPMTATNKLTLLTNFGFRVGYIYIWNNGTNKEKAQKTLINQQLAVFHPCGTKRNRRNRELCASSATSSCLIIFFRELSRKDSEEKEDKEKARRSGLIINIC